METNYFLFQAVPYQIHDELTENRMISREAKVTLLSSDILFARYVLCNTKIYHIS